MDYLVQFQINIFALFILLSLYLFVRISTIRTFSSRLLRVLIVATAVSIIMEPLTWIFDGMLFRGAFLLEYGTNFLLFLLGPVIGGLLLSYMDYRTYKNPRRVRERFYYQQVSFLTFLLLVVNIFLPIYFSVNPVTNSFSSGDYKEIHYVVLAGFYIYMLYFILRSRRKITRKESMIFILCFLLPIIGMVIQLYDSKLHFSWTSIVIGLMIIYVFLETTPSEEDYLTKLYNRKNYESQLNYFVQIRKPFGVVIFDLNYFKEINDSYGHQKGDEVLIAFGQALKKTFDRYGLVSRLGGDEFAVIIDGQYDSIEFLIEELTGALSHHEDPLVNKLEFSFGYQKHQESISLDELYNLADHKMYAHKQRIKKSQMMQNG
ncbi:diguanylate cyclase domain-containing protein [Proteiniclasticum sp. C24MP]|uniref:GGDEF domain-containing protein n=1 Tax=Proteiniclasticum sp. C24MP TaxID=3374101 RepID=UPI0037541E94